MKNLFLSILIFGSVTTWAQKVESKTITVEPYQSVQNYEHFKRMVLNTPDSPAEFISDFEFEWGYFYKLKVQETKLQPELSDGTRFEYVLEKIISKTRVPVDYEFQLALDSELYYHDGGSDDQVNNFKLQDDGTYLYFEEVEIVVPSEFQSEFKKIVNGSSSKRGQFKFLDKNRIQLLGLI